MEIREMWLVEFWETEIQEGEQTPIHGLFLHTPEGLEEINQDVGGSAGHTFQDGAKKLKNAKNARWMRLSRRKALTASGKGYEDDCRMQVDEVLKPYLMLTFDRFM